MSGDPGTGSQTFSYDALNRVTGSTGLAQSRSYTYDRNGNRRTRTIGSDTWTYVHDRTDQLVEVEKDDGTTQTSQNFEYDAYGNLTEDAQTGTGVTAMAYDLADRLKTIDPAGSTNDTTFTLDALGRFRTRAVGSASPVTDTYSYVGASETVARIATAGGTTLDSIVSAAGDRLGVKAGGTLNWLLPDLHGNVAASLEEDETDLANAIRYDAWGETIQTGAAPGGGSAAGADAWKYQGRLDVSPAGLSTPLYDMSARFYAPGLAAFTQLDSVAGSAQNPLSMNRFLYAHANPATLIDPTGHAALEYDNYSTPGRTSFTTSSGTKHVVNKSRPRQNKYRPAKGYTSRSGCASDERGCSKTTVRTAKGSSPYFRTAALREARATGGDPFLWPSFDMWGTGAVNQTTFARTYGEQAMSALANGDFTDANFMVVFEAADLYHSIVQPNRRGGLTQDEILDPDQRATLEAYARGSGDGWLMASAFAYLGASLFAPEYSGGKGIAKGILAPFKGRSVAGPNRFFGADGGGGGGVALKPSASADIANGHAFDKHVIRRGEFPGVRTRAEFAEVVESTMQSQTEKTLPGGRTAYWSKGVVVIRDPSHPNGGTAFVPRDGYAYFKGLK